MDGSLNADTTSRSWMGTLLACLLLALAYGSISAVGSFLLRGVDSHSGASHPISASLASRRLGSRAC